MYLYVLLCSGSLNYKLINIFYFAEVHDYQLSYWVTIDN